MWTTWIPIGMKMGSQKNLGNCDDTQGNVYPGAIEYCDGFDNDCNSEIDDNPQDVKWCQDLDQDVIASKNFIFSCQRPEGYVANWRL